MNYGLQNIYKQYNNAKRSGMQWNFNAAVLLMYLCGASGQRAEDLPF
jgi:hypothetical protein